MSAVPAQRRRLVEPPADLAGYVRPLSEEDIARLDRWVSYLQHSGDAGCEARHVPAFDSPLTSARSPWRFVPLVVVCAGALAGAWPEPDLGLAIAAAVAAVGALWMWRGEPR